ncbi:uridine phosphorylase [Treponema pallidum subsp. pallidum]|nr:uridine phosphorylase [Treponema pallidum subsp. pallidum str. Chicago]ANA42701.1 uridine phosphorylase [Treponema pallidum subsp. pallidum]
MPRQKENYLSPSPVVGILRDWGVLCTLRLKGKHMKLVYSTDCEYHIGLKASDIGHYVILPGDPARSEKIAQHFSHPHKVGHNREYVTYTGTLCETPVSVMSTGIGGPSTAIGVEELIHLGAHTFIRVGTSGGMQPDILAGTVVIATGAIRFEGTSKEYAPVEFPAVPDFTVTAALKHAAEDVQVRHALGVVQCKDNFYGQHSPHTMPVHAELTQKWHAWIACNTLASEMESAALFVLGSVRRVRTGAVLLVIGNQTRRAQGLEDIQVHDTENAIRVAVEAVKLLITQDSPR